MPTRAPVRGVPIADQLDYMFEMARREWGAPAAEEPAASTEDRDAGEARAELERDWRTWLRGMFPGHVRGDFAHHHAEFWDWLWPIGLDSSPRPFVQIVARDGGKSTSAELGTAALGLRGRRRYVLYVRDTQARANDSVQNIAALLESPTVESTYPLHAEPAVTKLGSRKAWRRSRLITAGGFAVEAIGLDVAARGLKLEDQRPDAIIFDDIDARHDTKGATEKKIATITDSLLPAGAGNTAVLGIQNLIIPNGVFARLSDGRATFLARRIVSGPHPAVVGLRTERVRQADGSLRNVIVAGEPTWPGGQRLAKCQALLDLIGLASFMRECQHQVKEREGALWSTDLLNRTRVSAKNLPTMIRLVVGVDPSGGGEEIGVVVCGLGSDRHGYVLADYTVPGHRGPRAWGTAAVDGYHEYEADKVVAEKNFGGDMVAYTVQTVDPKVPVEMVSASRGKAVRAEPVASLYEDERVHHVGEYAELEGEQTGWAPGDADSPNRMDAAVWALTELMLGPYVEPVAPLGIGGTSYWKDIG